LEKNLSLDTQLLAFSVIHISVKIQVKRVLISVTSKADYAPTHFKVGEPGVITREVFLQPDAQGISSDTMKITAVEVFLRG
jgi:hypothetical protein